MAITGKNIKDGEIKIADLALDIVDGTLIADDAVDSEHLAAGAVDLEHMSANSVDSDQYVDGSIDLAHMSANSVDSDQYVDASIDNAHLAANSVDSDQYVDKSIDPEHLKVVTDLNFAPTFVAEVNVVSGTSTYTVTVPSDLRIIRFNGYMTADGATGDTVKLDDGSNDISPAIDLSAKSDKDSFSQDSIDDAYNDIASAGTLRVVSASDAKCKVFIWAVNR